MKENQHAFENVVKSSYKVPYSLETHVLDATIPIGKKFVLSLHSIIFGLSILSIDLLLKNIPFFKHGSKLGFIIFIIGFDMLLWLLFSKRIKNGVTGYELFKNAFNHLAFQDKEIDIDKTTLYSTIMDLLPFSDLKMLSNHISETGVICVPDSSDEILVYEVIGFGSDNIFDAARNSVIYNYYNSLRMFPQGVTQYYVTSVAGQNITIQERALIDLRDETSNLNARSILREEVEHLRENVDGKFETFHQYLFIRYNSDADKANFMRWLNTYGNPEESVFTSVKQITEKSNLMRIIVDLVSPTTISSVKNKFDSYS